MRIPFLLLLLVLSSFSPVSFAHPSPTLVPSLSTYSGNLTMRWTEPNLTTYQGGSLATWEVCPGHPMSGAYEAIWNNTSLTSASGTWNYSLSGNLTSRSIYGSKAPGPYVSPIIDYYPNQYLGNSPGYQFAVPDLALFNLTLSNGETWNATDWIQFHPCLVPRLSLSVVSPYAGETVTADASYLNGTPPVSYAYYLNGTRLSCPVDSSSCNFTAAYGENNVTVDEWDASSVPRTYSVHPITVLVNATRAVPLSANLSATATTVDTGNTTYLSTVASGGTKPYSYAWSLNGTPLSDALSHLNFTPSTKGMWGISVTVTDGTGSTLTRGINITAVPPPVVTLSSSVQNILPGTPVNLTARSYEGTTPFRWTWYLNRTLLPDNLSYLDYVPAGSGNYTFTVNLTDAFDRSSETSLLLVCLSHPLPLGIGLGGPGRGEVGENLSFGVTISGGVGPYRVAWNSTAGSLLTQGNLSILDLAKNGTVSVIVTDSQGSSANTSLTVTAVPRLLLSTSPSGSVLLPLGHVLYLNASASRGIPPYQYRWYDNGTLSTNAPGLAFAPVHGGNYTFLAVVTDADVTVSALPVHVEVIPASIYPSPSLHIAVPRTTVDSGTPLPLVLTVLNGTPPFAFVLPSGVHCTTTTFRSSECTYVANVSLPSSIQLVFSVTDAYRYVATDNLSLQAYPSLSLSTTFEGGIVQLHISGGLAPYDILWSLPGRNLTNTTSISLSSGPWEVTVTDANHATARMYGNLSASSSTPVLLWTLAVVTPILLVMAVFSLWWIRKRKDRQREERRHAALLTGIQKEELRPEAPEPPDLSTGVVPEWDEMHEPEPEKRTMSWMGDGEVRVEVEHTCPSCGKVSRTSAKLCPSCFAYFSPPKYLQRVAAANPEKERLPIRVVERPPEVPQKVEMVRTLGERRHEEGPLTGSIRPEEVNPHVVHVDPALLQPMELNVVPDRGMVEKDRTETSSEERTKELMERAKRAKEGKEEA